MFGDKLKSLRTGIGITQSELANSLKISPSTIGMYEQNRREPSIEVLEAVADYFDVTIDFLLDKLPKKTNGVKIPVLGKVQAGIPIEAIEDILDYEEITPELAAKGEFFGLQIRGDSMMPRMLEGDVIIVRKQPVCENGDVAVVLVNGSDATVKKVRLGEKGITLIPFNTAFEPMYYTNEEIEQLPVRIIGKVVELRGKF